MRLNKKAYNEEDFVKAGIDHVEHFYLDGSCPRIKILDQVIEAFESVPSDKAFAVHCKAGLGRLVDKRVILALFINCVGCCNRYTYDLYYVVMV